MTRLDLSELGPGEASKVNLGKYRGRANLAKHDAVRFGVLSVGYVISLRHALEIGWYSEQARDTFADDAVMFARMAFRGWRAYRIMEGE